MNRLRPEVLLVVLILVVPLLVGGAGVASLLLLRAGYGMLVWGFLPLLGVLLSAGALGLVLGRAARGARPKDHTQREHPEGHRQGQNAREDDV